MRQYLEFNIRADVLPGVRVVEEVQDGGDESFIDATQLTVGHALKNGAESAPLCHHNRVLQGCRIKGPHRVLPTLLHCWRQVESVHVVCAFVVCVCAVCLYSQSSQTMAMQARTIRSRSCSPSLPTAMRELVTEEGKSSAFTVIICMRQQHKHTGQLHLSNASGVAIWMAMLVCQSEGQMIFHDVSDGNIQTPTWIVMWYRYLWWQRF